MVNQLLLYSTNYAQPTPRSYTRVEHQPGQYNVTIGVGDPRSYTRVEHQPV